MLISIIIPAFNEADYLGDTLTSLNRAQVLLKQEADLTAEIIVVDNDSDDATTEVARAWGAHVVAEERRNVAKARNSGARLSIGDVLVFVDADTVVPEELLVRIAKTMSDESCLGGAVDTDYRPSKLAAKIYLRFWRAFGNFMGLAQGATQFYRRDVFLALKGYDETLFMGEDVNLYWRLKRHATRHKGRVVLINDLRVVPSSRRFDQWRLWRTLIWTNPVFILLFQRSSRFWDGWYGTAPR